VEVSLYYSLLNDKINNTRCAFRIVGFVLTFLFSVWVHTNFIANFSGDVVDFEEWSRRAGATNKQSQYKKLIERTAEAGNVVDETRSQELYNMVFK